MNPKQWEMIRLNKNPLVSKDILTINNLQGNNMSQLMSLYEADLMIFC